MFLGNLERSTHCFLSNIVLPFGRPNRDFGVSGHRKAVHSRFNDLQRTKNLLITLTLLLKIMYKHVQSSHSRYNVVKPFHAEVPVVI